jgi:hypothetical protein
MKKSVAQSCLLVLTSSAIALSIATNSPAAQPTELPGDNASRRALQVREINRANARDEYARQRGIPLHAKSIRDERISLSGFVNGRPIYDAPVSAVNGVSLNVERVHQEFPESSFSKQFYVGVWDEAGAKTNHPELIGRVGNPDNIWGLVANHTTAVAGIIASSGVDPAARGMVPGAIIHAYNMTDDLIEMTSRAVELPLSPTNPHNILVSNHSYGEYVGWAQANLQVSPGVSWSGWYWFGEADEREDRRFGQYTQRASDWDTLVYSAPYYLPVRAAGNDRTEGSLSKGTKFRYWDPIASAWTLKTYDATIDPLPDNQKSGGFDTIGTFATAKNILTVGSVTPAVANGKRLADSARMSGFSSWGPTDDGRVKPDLVAVGDTIMILTGSSNVYASGSGTSYSAPAVTGAAMLLQQIHTLAVGDPMLASTVKALLIHTASDMGAKGPDYKFGWGLVDSLTAADLLRDHLAGSQDGSIQTPSLSNGGKHEFSFKWDGASPIRATIAWTDPAGTPKTGLNDRTPVIVNDLDLRIIGPDGTVHLPFALDPANPAALAVTADNVVDNVEQVLIESPIAGEYKLVVSHKGSLKTPGVNGNKTSQQFSLIVTGQAQPTLTVVANNAEVRHVIGSQSASYSWTIKNESSSTLSWSLKDAPEWLSFAQRSGTLPAQESIEVIATVNPAIPGFGPGYRAGEVVFSNSASAIDEISRVALDAWRPVTPDFVEDFEGGELTDEWRVTGIGQPRVSVTSTLGPIGGKHLLMDDYFTGGAQSRIEVTTLLNRKNWEDLVLSYDVKTLHDVTVSAHANPYIGGADTTGIAVSADGILWHEIKSLKGSNVARTYATQTIDLDDKLAQIGLDGEDTIYLRFAAYLRNEATAPTNMSGVAFDNIAITGAYTAPEPTEPEPTEPEPTVPEPTDPEPTDPEPTDPEPTEPEPTNPEPTEPEPTDPEPTDPGTTNPEPTDPAPTGPGNGKGNGNGKGKGKGNDKGDKTTDGTNETDQTAPGNGNGNNGNGNGNNGNGNNGNNGNGKGNNK